MIVSEHIFGIDSNFEVVSNQSDFMLKRRTVVQKKKWTLWTHRIWTSSSAVLRVQRIREVSTTRAGEDSHEVLNYPQF